MPMSSSEIVVIPKRFSGIRVLLIEPERRSLVQHAFMLSRNSYRVTSTTKASTGLSMIQSGHLYDCVLVDVDICEMDMVDFIHQVLRHQPELSIIMMLSDDIHTMRFVIEALKNEAILCLVKPCDLSDICNIWTHVYRKRIALEKRYYSKRKSPEANNILRRADPTMSKSLATFDRAMINHEISKKQPTDNDQPSEDDTYQKKRKDNKPRINWTEELHGKFLEALNTLGNQKAYPSEILKHMNVPGLTRNQVASHLQKLQGREKVIKRPRMGDNLQEGSYASKRNGQSILSSNHGSIIQSNSGGSQGNEVQMTGYGYNLSNNFNNGNFAVASVSSDEVRAREPFGFDNGNSSNYSSPINTNGVGSLTEPLAQYDCFGIPIESSWPMTPMTNSRMGGRVEPPSTGHGLQDLGSAMGSRFFRMGRNSSVGGGVTHEASIANQSMEDLALHEYVSHELGGFCDHPQDLQGNGENLFMGFLHHSMTPNSYGYSNLNLEPCESVGFSFLGERSNSSTREKLHVNSNAIYLGGGVQEGRVLNNDPFPHMTRFGVERTIANS